MTRQNIIPSRNDSQMIHALIPMWDMCNHEEGIVSFIILTDIILTTL